MMRYSKIFSYRAAAMVRAIAGSQCLVAIYTVVSANAVVGMFGPEDLGGKGDFHAKIEARVAAGEDGVEAGNKVRNTSID
jgi:hypothetical protein